MVGYTYILRCSDGTYYTGSTKELEVRLVQHQNRIRNFGYTQDPVKNNIYNRWLSAAEALEG